MKTIKFDIVLSIEYDIQEPQENELETRKRITRSIEDHFFDKIACSDSSADNASLKIKIIDPGKRFTQARVEKQTPFSNITAYFSADGPAFVANVHIMSPNYLTSDNDALTLTLADINAALREAHHKYLSQLHED